MTRVLLFPFSLAGRLTLKLARETGRVSLLTSQIILHSKYFFKDRKLFFAQAYEVGVKSLILIISIAFFTGTVLAYQSALQIKQLMPLTYLGLTVYKLMTLELGPVLTGVIMAGRYGSSIAAELGTMAVTEQIDALKSMSIDPVRYLGLPRFMASMTMLPVAVVFANLIGIIGGYVISFLFFNVTWPEYINEMRNHFDTYDITVGLIKTFVFGAIIAIIGCYVGFHTYGGAEGVGKATVKAFVISSVLILIFDLILAIVLL